THTEKTKCKVSARNNIIRKLTGTTWGANPQTLKSTALALCYSAAEYACPVWERAAHAKKLDPALNASCRLITGCLKSTPTDRLSVPGVPRTGLSRPSQALVRLGAQGGSRGHAPLPEWRVPLRVTSALLSVTFIYTFLWEVLQPYLALSKNYFYKVPVLVMNKTLPWTSVTLLALVYLPGLLAAMFQLSRGTK
ncbi:hypothetical protein NHX12_000017, partial [Muraenolepis orangiensis]